MRKQKNFYCMENTPNFPTVKTPKKTGKKWPEKSGISRTMEWLKIPEKTQALFAKNFLNISVDYMQYTTYNIAEPLKLLYTILGFNGQIDMDNSNIEYNHNYNLSLTHHETRMWHAYSITFHSPGFPPIPVGSVEVYHEKKKGAIKSEGKIVFYGSYFVFQDIIQEEAPEVIRFADMFENKHIFAEKIDWKPIYKRTRVDIAIDVSLPISQRWMTHYIKPHKNSRETVKPYNYQPDLWGFQSFGYIPHLTKGLNIRIYNKILDMKAKNKQAWYPEYGSEKIPNVTRIEIIYGGESAMNDINTLLDYTKYRILGDETAKLKTRNRPKSQYSALSAYEYFKRYAKNHNKSLIEVIDDVLLVATTEHEEKVNGWKQ